MVELTVFLRKAFLTGAYLIWGMWSITMGMIEGRWGQTGSALIDVTVGAIVIVVAIIRAAQL